MATFKTALDAITEGKSVRRAEWNFCRKIRAAKESDYDQINTDPTGLIVEDCKKDCDCAVRVWAKPDEDVQADDWIILNEAPVMATEEPADERSVATEA